MAATQFLAKHRYARITSRKAKLVADMIRGESVNQALEMLAFSPQRAAAMYLKVLRSAMANASQDEDVNLNRLYVSDCRADNGPLLQNRMRWRPGPQGRAMPYRKRTSHLTVVVSELLEEPAEAALPPRAKAAPKTEEPAAAPVADPEASAEPESAESNAPAADAPDDAPEEQTKES